METKQNAIRARLLKLFQDFKKPLATIKKQPLQFGVWWFIANILGLAGFWLPLFLVWYRGGEVEPVYTKLVATGALASFSMVILADGIATTLSVVGGSNVTAAGIRGMAGAGALFLVFIQAGMLYSGAPSTAGEQPKYYVQFVLTIIAVIAATYLYCFRFSDWEKTCGDVKAEEEKEVDLLKATATGKQQDGKGVTL